MRSLIEDVPAPVDEDPLNLPKNAKPLDVFEAIYSNPAFPVPMRLRAARDAAQYIHAKLAVTAVVPTPEDWIIRMDAAIAASNKIIEARKTAEGEWEASEGHQRHLTGKVFPK